jgi:hypothetical protein
MKIPTGHLTITSADNRRARGLLFRGAREGDVFICSTGNHWVCHGKQTARFGEARTWSGPAANLQNLPKDWRQERGIPAGVDVKYETSYTKRVVDSLMVWNEYSPMGQTIRAAAALLKDYHASLSAPYEQRDVARARLATAEAQRDQALDTIKSLKDRFRRRCKYLGERLIRYAKET